MIWDFAGEPIPRFAETLERLLERFDRSKDWSLPASHLLKRPVVTLIRKLAASPLGEIEPWPTHRDAAVNRLFLPTRTPTGDPTPGLHMLSTYFHWRKEHAPLQSGPDRFWQCWPMPLPRLLQRKEAELKETLRHDLCRSPPSPPGGTARPSTPKAWICTALCSWWRANQIAGGFRPARPGGVCWSSSASVGADVLFENTPVNYETGQPAVDHLRTALECGMHAITANKGPVVHAYRAPDRAGAEQGAQILFRIHGDGRRADFFAVSRGAARRPAALLPRACSTRPPT